MSTKTKKTIAIDLDDVLALSAKGFVDFSNQRWGTSLTVDDYKEQWAHMWGVDHEVEKIRAEEVYSSGTVTGFQKIDQAEDVLKELKKSYHLVITTSRARFIEKETRDWLGQHFKDIFEEIHFAGFYDDIKTDSHKHTKAGLIKSIGADYLIDDHPKHCFATAEAGIPALMFGDYIWSRDLTKLPKGVTQVKNWQEVLDFFDEERRKTI